MIEQIIDHILPCNALLIREFAKCLQSGNGLDKLWMAVVSSDVLKNHIDGVAMRYTVMRG